jgi:hypothetical protein
VNEKIPLKGATPEQLEVLHERLVEVRTESEMQSYLERVGFIGELVWYWQTKTIVRAAIITYSHSESRGGGFDLVVFESRGMRFLENRKRGHHEGGWTPRGTFL